MKASTLFKALPVVVLLAFTHSANAVSVSWGALAFSSITDCLDAFCLSLGTSSDQVADDDMTASVQTDLNEAGSRSFADATLSGSSFTPTLSVLADSTTTNAFPNLVLASASGVQGYTNTSSGTINVIVDLNLSADHVTGFGAPGPLSLGTVSAFAVVFLNTASLEVTEDTLGNIFLGGGFENNAGSAILNAPAGGPPPAEIPDQMDSFSFDVAAGENFLIWAGLQALASSGGIGDARNTLTVDLRDINLDNFSIASGDVAVIPLPAGVWLFLTGIGIVAGLSRRRKSLAAS